MIKKEPLGFLDPELIPWQPEAGIDGLYTKTLARCPDTGSYTRMLKVLPGTDTSLAGVQTHDHLEEVWILSGALHDIPLDRTFTAGMYAHRLPGMSHGPWTASLGALTVEVRDFDPDRLITKDQIEFTDTGLLEWTASDADAGFYLKTLTSCEHTGSYGRLVKLHPGANGPRETRDGMGRSELWVVQGQLQDLRRGDVHPAGTYGNLVIDLLDGSWTSPGGCVVFEVRNLI